MKLSWLTWIRNSVITSEVRGNPLHLNNLRIRNGAAASFVRSRGNEISPAVGKFAFLTAPMTAARGLLFHGVVILRLVNTASASSRGCGGILAASADRDAA